MKKVCIIGCGAIGSLYAAHLARVAEVWAFVRREDHAAELNRGGLRVSGTHNFVVPIKATTNAKDLPDCDLGIVATKATQVKESFRLVGRRFDKGAVLSAQNGVGSEEIIAKLTRGYVIRATTFMSGTRHSDTHVQYELDTPTWMGPFEPTATPFSVVKEAAELIVAAGLKAEALQDARPAQWSKLIFNSSVNSVSALTGLPHSPHFSDEAKFSDLGLLLHDLIDEGKRVAEAAGVRVVKGFGQEEQEIERLEGVGKLLYASRVRAVRLMARYNPALSAVPALGQVGVLALGGWMAIHGEITLGTFLAFSS